MAAEISVGGGYSIDLDDAQKFIDALQGQLDGLKAAASDAQLNLLVFPPGHDDYSAAWARSATEMVKAHTTWNQNKQKELQDLMNKVKDVVAKYKQTEHDNTMRS